MSGGCDASPSFFEGIQKSSTIMSGGCPKPPKIIKETSWCASGGLWGSSRFQEHILGALGKLFAIIKNLAGGFLKSSEMCPGGSQKHKKS